MVQLVHRAWNSPSFSRMDEGVLIFLSKGRMHCVLKSSDVSIRMNASRDFCDGILMSTSTLIWSVKKMFKLLFHNMWSFVSSADFISDQLLDTTWLT